MAGEIVSTPAVRGSRWETRFLAEMTPELAASGVARYVHQYEGNTSGRQQLSRQMRELLATCALIREAEGVRFAASHIRVLWHMGVTTPVVLEAIWGVEPVFGRANMLRGVQAIHLARDPSNPEGSIPPGGEPTELVDFPELHLGNDRPAATDDDPGLGPQPEVAYIARLDPKLAEMMMSHHNLVYRAGGLDRPAYLPSAALELFAIAALSIRGFVDLAADHMQRAVRLGATPHHILEAISAVAPPTGQATIQMGALAMMRAGIEPS